MLNVKINNPKPLEVNERDALTISAHSLKGFTLVKSRGVTKAYWGRSAVTFLPWKQSKVAGSPAKPAHDPLSAILFVLKICFSNDIAVN